MVADIGARDQRGAFVRPMEEHHVAALEAGGHQPAAILKRLGGIAAVGGLVIQERGRARLMEHPLHKHLAPVIARAGDDRAVVPGVILALLDIRRLRADLGTRDTEDLICRNRHIITVLCVLRAADVQRHAVFIFAYPYTRLPPGRPPGRRSSRRSRPWCRRPAPWQVPERRSPCMLQHMP